MLVRVREVAPFDLATSPGTIEEPPSRTKACLDVAQAFPVGELSEHHRREVILGRKRSRVSTHRIQLRAPAKLFRMRPLEYLRRHRFPWFIDPRPENAAKYSNRSHLVRPAIIEMVAACESLIRP